MAGIDDNGVCPFYRFPLRHDRNRPAGQLRCRQNAKDHQYVKGRPFLFAYHVHHL
jgi:hypothetical protein